MGDVMERVLTSATVDLSEQVETPDALLAVQVPYKFVAPVSVAEKVGTTPPTGTWLES